MSAGILVLQHIACEPPGIYEDVLVERGIELHRVEVDEGEPLPDWHEYRAVVVMGGPMGANDDHLHPWLVPEKRLIADAARAGVPVWGVCLGAQLLAAALGARVYVGSTPEVGMGEVELTECAAADPVFGGLAPRFAVFQWHSDTFDLPDGARRHATSSQYRNQAFSWGSSYGVQFHAEVTPQLAAQWVEVPEYARSLESVRGPGSSDRTLVELQHNATATEALARAMFHGWLTDVVRIGSRVA